MVKNKQTRAKTQQKQEYRNRLFYNHMLHVHVHVHKSCNYNNNVLENIHCIIIIIIIRNVLSHVSEQNKIHL